MKQAELDRINHNPEVMSGRLASAACASPLGQSSACLRPVSRQMISCAPIHISSLRAGALVVVDEHRSRVRVLPI